MQYEPVPRTVCTVRIKNQDFIAPDQIISDDAPFLFMDNEE